MLTTRSLRRLEVWSGYAAAGGARTAVLGSVTAATARENLDGSRSLTFAVPLTAPNVSAVAKRAVIRVDQDDLTFDEWRVVQVLDDKESGMRQAMCADFRTTDLAEAPPVFRVDSDKAVSLRFESVGLTPTEHINQWVLPALAAGGITYVSLGTITPTARIDLTFDWTGPLAVLLAIAEKTGMELDIRRVGSAGYAIDLVPALGSSAAVVDLRLGRNMSNTLRHTEDTVAQATRVYPKGGATDDEQATIAKATWLVTAQAGTVITLADPNGGDGPIAFDGQFVGMYLRLQDGTLSVIGASSAAAQTVTLGTVGGSAPPPQIFNASGNLVLSALTTMEVLIVAGGGAGGPGNDRTGGGGGGGGVIHIASLTLPAGSYPVVVGAGGTSTTTAATAGGDSSFNGNIAKGGGRGAYFGIGGSNCNGGSGGGGYHGQPGGSGVAGQGNNGGLAGFNSGSGSGVFTGSGGGGAGAAGVTGTAAGAGKGGDGLQFTTSGAAQYYGGGGGGSAGNYGGQTIQGANGGLGGGGKGGTGLGGAASGTAGTPNTGGGGGGGAVNGSTGGAGGSGVVIFNFGSGTVVATPSVGDYVQFRLDDDGTELTYLENPTDAAAYGVKSATLERSDIPSTNNRVKNSALRTWAAGLPVNWTKVGTPTVTQTVAAPFTRFGGSSAKVDTTADGQGLISDAVPIFPTANNRYVSGFAELWAVSGNVRVELVFTTAGGPVSFPTLPNAATPSVLGQWSELGASGADAYAMGATAVQIRIVQHGSTASSFYVDGAQITEGAAQLPFTEGSGPTQLWQAANQALKTTLKPAVSYDIGLVDLERLDPTHFALDCTIQLGAVARITDPDMAIIGATTRIVEYARDYMEPGNTTVVLSTRPTDLAGLLATAERAARTTPSTEETTDVPPSLTVTATPSAINYSIVWTAAVGALVQLSINNGAWTTAPASPILVSRPGIGGVPLNYSFRTTLNDQTVTNSVDIMPLDADTTTPDLTVTPSIPTATTQTFNAVASNPRAGGVVPTMQVILRGCTAAGGSIAPGTYAFVSGSNITVDRPAFGTSAQASIEFVATLSGGGSERIQRTILTQVKDQFGPSLTVTSVTSLLNVSISYVLGAGSTLELAIDNGAFSVAPASPILVSRDGSDHNYAFRATKDSQAMPGSAFVPKLTTPQILSITVGAQDDVAQSITVSWTSNSSSFGGAYHDAIHYELYLDGVFSGGGGGAVGSPITVTPASGTWAYDTSGPLTGTVRAYAEVVNSSTNESVSQSAWIERTFTYHTVP